ncbi:SagB family peptide dehydrogenase [Cryobacterium sp. N21]|uniref:SagB family peptide dehydrogenase n=1 Tax=Cryobacterium sp. N21 TaxID=2048289 RepID=UPI000CE52BC7|nr:SagB family peptide dehydrogenase [Cryobacterium sp. N21]
MTGVVGVDQIQVLSSESQDGHWRAKLLRGVYQVTGENRETFLAKWPAKLDLGVISDTNEALLRDLADDWVDVSLPDLAVLSGVSTESALILKLIRGGWLEILLIAGGQPLLTIVPRRSVADYPQFHRSPKNMRASKFAIVVRAGDEVRLELPHSWADAVIHSTNVLDVLWHGISAEIPDNGGAIATALRWLEATNEGDPEGFNERQWSAHELWFHERTRRYGRARNFGGTFWAKDEFPALPALPKHRVIEQFSLPSPPFADNKIGGSLHQVLEDRRSFRVHDDANALTLDQLGEFLYRSVRTRLSHRVDGVEYLSRPHPSGGSAYEIDTFIAVRNVVGLRPGLYHYDSFDHGLDKIDTPDPGALANLIRIASHSSTVKSEPQVVIFFVARVGRILWKYEQMGYAVMLKHVGVVMQTMYLVASDMGLAPCAIGSGDSDLFSAATGLDPLTDVTIGEFLLGSRSATEEFTERPA